MKHRWGALGWVSTLQFLVVERVVAATTPRPYRARTAVISDLGARSCHARGPCSPDHLIMNVSFVALGVGVGLGAVALLRGGRTVAARVAGALLATSALGVVVVGCVPEDTVGAVHGLGAALHLLGGGLGLVALGLALGLGLAPGARAAGAATLAVGVVSGTAAVLFVSGHRLGLGAGLVERVAVLPVPVVLAALALGWWWHRRPRRGGASRVPSVPDETMRA